MWDALVAGLLAGLGIAVPVGAISLLILESGMRCGFRQAFAAGAGAAAVDFLYALVAAVAGALAADWLAAWAKAFATVGGMTLLVLGAWGLGKAARRRSAAITDSCGGPQPAWPLTFVRFVGLTLVNPLTLVYFAALTTGTAAGRTWSTLDLSLFVGGAATASLGWQTLLAWLGHSAGRILSQRSQAVLSVLGNLIVCGLGLQLALRAL